MQIHETLAGVIHVAEASIIGARVEQIADRICSRMREYCISIRPTQSEMRLIFDDAHAIIRRADKSLIIRLEAADLAMLCGVQMILQMAILDIVSPSHETLVWRAPALFDVHEGSRR
ncbi:SMa0974 family conjugal transfer regulator [Shinella sedimenti]|uniref:Uncharacterized protein n=1 Tax=Shinella sedimenti TaxID=2919913 RepID=A0ABT0CT69_9HYPH|nr:hypothetical protein [Shinella sedimenti]MCJ8151752.1 hypothetical protein [Shinella sedimenti]